MILTRTVRRVPPVMTGARDYVSRKNSKNGSGGDLCQEDRRLRPSPSKVNLRSYTLSVPAQEPRNTRAHRPDSPDVTGRAPRRDVTAMLASAAANPAVSDRQLRVYTILVTVLDRGADSASLTAAMPSLSADEAAQLLGRLAAAGLLTSRLRNVGYHPDGRRIRRRFYELAGGDL